MEGEIIPMCEDQGMAIVPWSALGSRQLMSAEQRRERELKPDASQPPMSEKHRVVSEMLERIANEKRTSLQAIVRRMTHSLFIVHLLTQLGPSLPVPPVDLCLPYRRGQYCDSGKSYD